jgi:hypothetical protein
MLAQEDPELFIWLMNAHTYAGDFLKALAEAGLRADPSNYSTLRPLLLEMKAKYPKYTEPPEDTALSAKRRYVMKVEEHNIDGTGVAPTHVYYLPPKDIEEREVAGTKMMVREYWPAVTDVACPLVSCDGIIRWAEAGYVPGYRICDRCGRHFLARGDAQSPTLIRMRGQRGGFFFDKIRRERKKKSNHGGMH